MSLRCKGKKAAQLREEFKAGKRETCCKALSVPYPWLCEEHKANCRWIIAETAVLVERLLR